MTARPHPFYRSTAIRWCFIGTGAFLAFALSPWSPASWRQAPSLVTLSHSVPLWVGSALFAVYVVLHLVGSARAAVVAAFLGVFLYACELIALLFVTSHHRPVNAVLFAALFLTCALHFAAGRLALYERDAR